LSQVLKLEDLAIQYKFCHEILAGIENYNDLLARFIFGDEATFHISGKMNGHNVCGWGTELPCVILSTKEIN
jgi:hypothetical protein